MKNAVCVFLLIVCNNVESARILGVFPPPARSHYILANNLMRGLAERGHEVTLISSFKDENPPKNASYKDITITGLMEQMQDDLKGNMFDHQDHHAIFVMPFFAQMLLRQTENTLADENVQKLLKSNAKFDVVIVEQCMNEAHKALAAYFEAPLITFSTVGGNSWFNPLVGNPQPLAYVPEILLNFGTHMTFWQRLENTITWTFNLLFHHLYIYPKQRALVEKFLPGIDFDQVLYNSSLVLVNSHPSTNIPVPYVPNMIDIGGFHVQPPKKLPQDLQQALVGVTYLGSPETVLT